MFSAENKVGGEFPLEIFAVRIPNFGKPPVKGVLDLRKFVRFSQCIGRQKESRRRP